MPGVSKQFYAWDAKSQRWHPEGWRELAIAVAACGLMAALVLLLMPK
jgi:hypothetical protein